MGEAGTDLWQPQSCGTTSQRTDRRNEGGEHACRRQSRRRVAIHPTLPDESPRCRHKHAADTSSNAFAIPGASASSPALEGTRIGAVERRRHWQTLLLSHRMTANRSCSNGRDRDSRDTQTTAGRPGQGHGHRGETAWEASGPQYKAAKLADHMRQSGRAARPGNAVGEHHEA